MKYALVFLGGVAAGLLIADQYAKWKAGNATSSVLNAVGLGFAAPTVSPIISGLIG